MANTVGTLLLQLKADTSAFVKGMGDAKQYAFDSSAAIVDSVKRIGDQLGRLNFDNLKTATRSFEMMGGIAAGVGTAVAAAVVGIGEEVAQNAKQMDKLSQSYGVSIETVSSLRVASQITGVSLDDLTMGMGRLARNAAMTAETGTGPAAIAFQKLGVQVTDSTGKLRPMDQLILDVSGKFAAMQDGTTKTALAMQLFGRAGAVLIPFLNEGRDGIQKMRELSDQLGLTWSGKDAESAKQFAEQVEILELKSTAFKEQLAKGVMPALDQVTTAFMRVDQSGGSLARSLGSTIGEAFKFIAKQVEAAGIGVDILFLKMEAGLKNFGQGFASGSQNKYAQMAGPLGPLIGGVIGGAAGVFKGGGNEEINAQIGQLISQYNNFVNTLDSDPVVVAQREGKTGPVPGFGTADDLTTYVAGLDDLTKKTQELLQNADRQIDKDPLQRLAQALNQQIQALQTFQALHPEAIWASINGQVEKLQQTLQTVNDLIKKNTDDIMRMATEMQGKGLADAMSKIPTAQPKISLDTQRQAAVLKQQSDLAKIKDTDPEAYARGMDDLIMKIGTAHQGMQVFIRDWQQNLPTAAQQAYSAMGRVLGGMQQGFQNFFYEVLMGTKSIGQAFRDLGLQILGSMVDAFAKILAQWIMTNVIMKAISAIFGTNIQAQATQQIATNSAEAMSAAGLAAANTLALTSAMYPPPVPEALAAVAYGMGMSFAGLASAAGGMEVDRDQLAFVHKDEKILPAKISKGFNDIINFMLPRGGSQPALAGAGGMSMPTTFHVHGANDPQAAADKIWSVLQPRIRRMKKDSGY